MLQYAIKVIITAALVIVISEVAKRSSLFGALIASLPLTSIFAIVWLWHDTADSERIAALTQGIFWLVLPSLVFFVALPVMLRSGWAFWPSLGVSAGLTAAAYLVMVRILARWGIAA
jgi:F0F1-type ATP synthase assembly protein I